MSETFNQPPQSIAQTIEWLHKILGRPALPECPQECERDCGVPGGKAPAWINRSGKAIKVTWTPYQSQLPAQADLKKWFALTTGIGTLGGGPNTQGHYIGFVDLDHKEGVFSSTEVFEARLHQWLSDYPLLQQSPRFRTPSGGYRVILAFTEKPDWTAFSLDLDGQRMGELLARNGGHTLLPPTLGANGIAYQWEYFVAYPPVVQRPEDVGIFPTRRKHIQQDILPRPLGNYVPGAIRLEDLISTHAKDILIGGAKKGDRSDAINALAQECYGWEEFCRRNSIPYTGSTQELVQYAWGQMEDAAIDPNKWQRILKTINPAACQTAAEYRSGDEESCWKKIYRLERTTFEDKCPPHIKDRIKAEWGMDRRHQAESSGGGKLQEPNAQEPRTNVVKQSESHLSKVSSLVEEHQQLDSDNKQKENILLQYIDTLLERGNIPQSERKAEYAQIGQALELAPKYVEQVAASRVQERQLAEVCNEKALIEELRSKRKTGLDLYEILPNEIASTLSQVAMALPTSPEHLITTGWSTFGAMIGTAAEIVAWSGFKQKTPVLWTISTARSGKLKSQTQEVMVNPIRLLQREANNEYRIALKSYNDSQKAALQDEDSDSADSLPPPPVPREYWVEHITVEALIRTINENPRGFLVYRDEIDGFFKALNKYRGGKGDDEAFYLTLNNGGGPKVILIERERRVDVERSCVPITGTIQRKTLDEEMTPQKISSGWMAR